ncbi:hypothetical protein [Streptomyces venezuelae]|uniref:Uncharacterized protein n=1 Tax=Streptomyces venezuelae TaxID=54571 RepID=A0A5P2C6Z7_STRVZ|nr:hypothetical protein [Streptomyces venezuelae]QES38157.1 hypothetical protein DEJ48_36315 [Streptomyces venezuelae]
MAIRVTAGPASTPAGRRRAEEARRLLDEELSRVRQQAESWRNGLAALLALLTTVGVVKGPDSIQGLTAGTRRTVGILLLGGLALAALGAFLAMRAAFGMPRRRLAEASLEELLVRQRTVTRRAVTDLRRAIVAGFTALAAVTAAVGLTWYGERVAAPGFRVVETSGTARCGELLSMDEKFVRIRVSGAEERRIQLSRVVSAKPVPGGCPKR